MKYIALAILSTSILLSGCSTKSTLSSEDLAEIQLQEKILNEARTAKTQEEAISSLLKAGSLGSDEAYYELARLYATNKQIPRDYQKSDVYLKLASNLGNNSATMLLAWNSLYGVRTEKNEELGIRLMKKAAESDPRAKRELGLFYGNLRHPFLDKPSKGLKLLSQASEEGDSEAAYYEYILAKKLGKDKKAENALAVAAERNHPKALLSHARIAITEGKYMIARESLLNAALSNDSEAMYELGKGMASGIFPPTQTVEGISKEAETLAWLAEASSQKHLQAKEMFDKLNLEHNLKGSQEFNQVIKSIEEQITPWNPNNL